MSQCTEKNKAGSQCRARPREGETLCDFHKRAAAAKPVGAAAEKKPDAPAKKGEPEKKSEPSGGDTVSLVLGGLLGLAVVGVGAWFALRRQSAPNMDGVHQLMNDGRPSDAAREYMRVVR